VRREAVYPRHAHYGETSASYPDRAVLLSEYPFLEAEDLNQALRYAAATVDDESLGIDRVA